MKQNIKIARQLIKLAKSLINENIIISSKHTNYDIIKKIAENVRNKIVNKYGTGDKLRGHCVEASDLIVEELNKHNIASKSPEGYILLDDTLDLQFPYDSHVWVEAEGYFIDVTIEQFNDYLKATDKPFPPICIFKKRPKNLVMEEPTYNKFTQEYEY